MKILDEFDSRVDSSELIASYPIPCFSSNMIPNDGSAYTILAVKCDQELYKSSLKYWYDIQSNMIETFDITHHCLQLLAVESDPTILYWTIPKCVIHLISTNIPQHSEYLLSKGVLEVLVYPDIQYSFGNHVSTGLLAFCGDSKLIEIKVATANL